MKIEHDTRHGELKLYVTAPAGVHHSTIAAAAAAYARGLVQPLYTSTPAGVTPAITRPGEWCRPAYSGPWRRVGSSLEPDTNTRKTFTAWPVPAPVAAPAPAPRVLFALWNGGAGNYARSSAPEDVEVFTSLQAVKDELQARDGGWAHIVHLDGSTEDTRTPCTGDDAEFLVWTGGDGTEYPECGTRVFFGPRGGIRAENF